MKTYLVVIADYDHMKTTDENVLYIILTHLLSIFSLNHSPPFVHLHHKIKDPFLDVHTRDILHYFIRGLKSPPPPWISGRLWNIIHLLPCRTPCRRLFIHKVNIQPHQFPRNKVNVAHVGFYIEIRHGLEFNVSSKELLWPTLVGLISVALHIISRTFLL
jgi:hypothetical protein